MQLRLVKQLNHIFSENWSFLYKTLELQQQTVTYINMISVSAFSVLTEQHQKIFNLKMNYMFSHQTHILWAEILMRK